MRLPKLNSKDIFKNKFHNFLKILSYFELLSAFKWILLNGDLKKLNNPYHNIQHTINMVIVAYHLMNKINEHNSIFTRVCYQTLVLAILFHDYDHLGGYQKIISSFNKDSDAINIERAIFALETFIKEHPDHKNDYIRTVKILKDTPNSDYTKIINLIKVTQYPYIKQCESTLEKIIRDADLLSTTIDENYFQFSVLGLAEESNIGYTKTNQSDQLVKKQIESQIGFYNNLQFNLPVSTLLFKNQIIKQKDDLIFLSRIIGK